ncbi:hypothetical protein NQ315_016657 [Exocentrus adspersus]|uniref:Uncharacterized protein n=1 Tax=Exocentrus adspersus TaxID=1586481 RepID=A0AAV8VQ65_9CUCU|nr:hypothetical protein NQ315_016657 [Exocentrus adspersus]
MLQMLDKAAKEASATPQYDGKTSGKSTTPEDREYMSKWSGDNRTYIAAKPLPGQGALIYMAVSSDPSLGWDRL